MAEKIELQFACAQGRLVITTEYIRFYPAMRLRRGKGWWVARSSISGATTFSDADGQRLAIFTRGGKEWDATRVAPIDALRAVHLLGYASVNAVGQPSRSSGHAPIQIKCRNGKLSIGEDRVSMKPRFGLHRHSRPWTVSRAIVSGVSCVGVDHAGLLRSLAVYTSGGAALPVEGVSPTDTRRIVETLGAFAGAVPQVAPAFEPELEVSPSVEPDVDPSATRGIPQTFGRVYPSEAMA
jgi:hypothetical protein